MANTKSKSGVVSTPIKGIAEKANALLLVANEVDSGSLADLCKWLDSGASKLGGIVGDVKSIKKDILKSDAKSKVKADMYFVTTPLIKVKVKVSDIRSVFTLHHKRLRNIVAMCKTLSGESKGKGKGKKKGGAK